MKLYKEFFFEAAHYLHSAPSGHPNARIHGHSFRVRLTVQGTPDPQTGLVIHFGDIQAIADKIRGQLDHQMLNNVSGLETSTIENISRWIWDQAKPALPSLCEVMVSRDTCMEGCIYSGD